MASDFTWHLCRVDEREQLVPSALDLGLDGAVEAHDGTVLVEVLRQVGETFGARLEVFW
jgi:hypothetical protein